MARKPRLHIPGALYHVILRGPDPAAFLGDGPGAPWSVDVDPETLL